MLMMDGYGKVIKGGSVALGILLVAKWSAVAMIKWLRVADGGNGDFHGNLFVTCFFKG